MENGFAAISADVKAQSKDLRKHVAEKAEWAVAAQQDGVRFQDNVPAAIQNQMREDLDFLQTIQGNGASPLHREIFGPVDGPSYFRFFESRIKTVGYNEKDHRPDVLASVDIAEPDTLWLTQLYAKVNVPRIYRLAALLHESRHAEDENFNWPHSDCPDPFKDEKGDDIRSIVTGVPLAGLPACDRTAVGSYGIQTIMLKNIERFCSSCNESTRKYAGFYGDNFFKRIIDREAKKALQEDLYP
ncbi:MAG: hypothetical protein AAB268_09505 [Elusimicrobiota bacterium]